VDASREEERRGFVRSMAASGGGGGGGARRKSLAGSAGQVSGVVGVDCSLRGFLTFGPTLLALDHSP
jgi:hypothetical protein